MGAAADWKPSWQRPNIFRRFSALIGRSVPVFVWLGAIAIVLVLGQARGDYLPYRGVAEPGRFTVKTPTPGRLSGLLVRELDRVEAGQIVGTLDESSLLLRLARARSELDRLQADLQREDAVYRIGRADTRNDLLDDHRRFVRDRESAELDVLEAQAGIEEDKIVRQGLAIEVARMRPLIVEAILSDSELTQLEMQHDAVAERVRQQTEIVSDRQEILRAAEARLSAFEADLDQPLRDVEQILLAPTRWSIRAQQIELESIALARTQLQLRAPAAGQVETIMSRPGQVLIAGDVLLTIVEPEPRALVAFVPATDIDKIQVGMTALVQRASAVGPVLTTRVTSLGAAARQVPPRFWVDSRIEEWALPVFLEPPTDPFALPGEALRIQLVPAPANGH